MNAPRALLLASLFLASASSVACGPAAAKDPTPSDPSHPVELQPDSISTCPGSLDAYCKTADCLQTWTAADGVCMNAPFQDPEGPADPLEYSTACGGYFALSQGDVTAYYDANTQALTAVVDAKTQCTIGPAGFTPPTSDACALTTCGQFSCGVPGVPDGGTGM